MYLVKDRLGWGMEILYLELFGLKKTISIADVLWKLYGTLTFY